MSNEQLAKMTQPQRDRLAYIELRLRFIGEIRRQDLVSRFGIQAAAATRDIGIYKNIAQNNLDYDTRNKVYCFTQGFEPIFDFQAERVLAWLSQGFGDGEPSSLRPWITCEFPTMLTNPELDTLSCVTRAIHQQNLLKVTYYSLLNGKTEREIAPSALINDGLNWHIRAFDRLSKDFRDFVITRMKHVVMVKDSGILLNERSDQDIQWTRIVELELVPHPDQPHPEIAEMDYSMTGGMVKMRIRAATAGYILRKWNVDCSVDHSLRGSEYRLWLRDHLALYGVKSAVLAPGYALLNIARADTESD